MIGWTNYLKPLFSFRSMELCGLNWIRVLLFSTRNQDGLADCIGWVNSTEPIAGFSDGDIQSKWRSLTKWNLEFTSLLSSACTLIDLTCWPVLPCSDFRSLHSLFEFNWYITKFSKQKSYIQFLLFLFFLRKLKTIIFI